jgi:large subunit ribosomal protein L24
MKKEFSPYWVGSKRPGKQRKYLAKAPLHLRTKLMSVNLTKELRKKISKRNITLRKGDTVKVTSGKFKGKTGKVTKVDLKRLNVTIDGVQVKKMDGSKVNVKLRPSTLQITELNLDDKKRIKNMKEESKEKAKEEKK